jgi:hypothetical protein
MDDFKSSVAKHHEDAAQQHEAAAKMHREAAKHCASGNFEKAERLATSAAEADIVASRHAVEAVALYHQHTKESADQKAEEASEEASRVAKHEEKAAAKE